MGTVAYVSPEQIRGDAGRRRARTSTPGLPVFEMPDRNRAVRRPLGGGGDLRPSGGADSVAERARGDAAPAIDPVLARGMAKDPADRYESCGALVVAAAEALDAVRPREQRRPRARGAVGRVCCWRSPSRLAWWCLPRAARGRPGARHRCAREGGSAHERGGLRQGVRGYPGELAVTPGGLWMADFRGGVLWRYEPGADRLERMTSNGEPRDLAGSGARSTWGPTAVSCPA